MDNRKKRGQILRELRVKKGCKQSEIATLLNITPQAYQRYEYGGSEPNGDGFQTLADFYGVTLDYIFDREQSKCEAIDELTDTDAEKHILQAYFRLDKELRAKIWEEMTKSLQAQIEAESDDYIVQTTTVGEELDKQSEAEKISNAKAENAAV